jgi:transcription initiation factor IIE alpha subunit
MNCKKCHTKMDFKKRIETIRFFRCPICDCITQIEDGKKRIDMYKG